MAKKPTTLIRKSDFSQPTGSNELAMLDVYMPMMKSSAIIAAGRLGLFEALAVGPLSVAKLAAKIDSSNKGTAALTDFLIALGYLEKHGDHLANTASTQRWFTSRGKVDYTPGLLWTHEAWSMMGGLAEAVRGGHPENILWNAMVEKPHLGDLFSSYMAAFASDLGADLLKHVPVQAEYRQLLDLGGSHGLHAIRFCHHYPQLNAAIVDLPSALTKTGKTIKNEGLSERIDLIPGDLQEQNWGINHDLVFYLSVAHNHTVDENRLVFQRIFNSLNPGGLLVIHEYLTKTPKNALDAAFRLTLLLETGTQTYSYDDYSNWLTEAGFKSVELVHLDPREKGSFILARH
ncbi:MAG: hypothetical protein CVU24_01065 [Betaproteobacteria bacterium HGW-Betaproteobacteria-18]|jgi:predicted O-methyltransferase YrrM|nr:MAG: hypothetical protein CVU32_01545 [Betaproteobacteria bacterium HGW-Betaproteobacteria-5]PKO40596.1 MAG: hypothetical protein CVU33_02145 [Betaproteobacteria bacterium HGW-Betaproteobacteria-6]PKO63030.1 MAG: hypothetical protein CVU24_01065 [Betaproteobacteria bacterium HGW-Betaproteobacteria-18]